MRELRLVFFDPRGEVAALESGVSHKLPLRAQPGKSLQAAVQLRRSKETVEVSVITFQR